MSGMAALERTLAAWMREADAEVAWELSEAQDWASGTFSGERAVVTLRLTGPGAGAAAKTFLAEHRDREWSLPRHLVADIGLVDEATYDAGSVVLRIEALLIQSD